MISYSFSNVKNSYIFRVCTVPASTEVVRMLVKEILADRQNTTTSSSVRHLGESAVLRPNILASTLMLLFTVAGSTHRWRKFFFDIWVINLYSKSCFLSAYISENFRVCILLSRVQRYFLKPCYQIIGNNFHNWSPKFVKMLQIYDRTKKEKLKVFAFVDCKWSLQNNSD